MNIKSFLKSTYCDHNFKLDSSNKLKFGLYCLFLIYCNLPLVCSHNYLDSLSNYDGRCEEIQISFCRDLPYNKTILPNSFDHKTQNEVRNHLRIYEPLIKLKCSPYLQLFLCTIYAPICTNIKNLIPPCSNLCISAKFGCEKFINNSDLDKKFNCSNFPLFDSGPICIWKPDDYVSIHYINKDRSIEDYSTKETFKYNSSRTLRFSCPLQFKTPPKIGHFFNLNGKKYHDCVTPCDEFYFDKTETNFIRIWTGVLAIICSILSLFTILTFLINTKRFQYPERQIVFISLCYFFIGIIYFIGFMIKDNVACLPAYPNPPGKLNLEMIRSVTQGSSKNAYCTLIAMSLYYFTMASSIWWVLLTISWYIQTGPKWGHEGIEKKAHYYHLIAWTIPAIKTILVISMNKVEGDQLSGVCYVGLLDKSTLMNYVFWPLLTYLIIGSLFLTVALIEMWKIKVVLTNNGTNSGNVVKLMAKIALFSLFYIIPKLVLIICYLFEYNRFDNWSLNWLNRNCNKKEYGIPCPNTNLDEDFNKPNLNLFLIKYTSLLIIGITSSIWIWSEKTINLWHAFNERLYKKIFRNCNKTEDETYI